ncbi:hypothetical protein TNCV_4835931 [Trichonephila clavipes]|nr:hypothetical protein TNCV_4835931 [Trichonephila clavipes]
MASLSEVLSERSSLGRPPGTGKVWMCSPCTTVFPRIVGNRKADRASLPYTAGLLWYRARTHDMPAMIRYLDHWATTTLTGPEVSERKCKNCERD